MIKITAENALEIHPVGDLITWGECVEGARVLGADNYRYAVQFLYHDKKIIYVNFDSENIQSWPIKNKEDACPDWLKFSGVRLLWPIGTFIYTGIDLYGDSEVNYTQNELELSSTPPPTNWKDYLPFKFKSMEHLESLKPDWME